MSAATLVFPLEKAKSVVPERIDQGVDYSAAPGSPIEALGPGQITEIVPNFYAGQPAIVERLSAAAGGQEVFYAEQLTPGVHVGQNVAAGQPIATVAPSGTGLELGYWGPGTGYPYARTHGGYSEGRSTAAGKAISDLFASLGGPAGKLQPGGLEGTAPPGSGALQGAHALGASAGTLNPVDPLGILPGDSSVLGGGNPITDAVVAALKAVFSAFFDFIKGSLLKASLYAVLVGGGVALAAYGLVRTMEPTGIPERARLARLAAVAA